MSEQVRLTVELHRPVGPDKHGYDKYEDLAELTVELPPELAWELYRYCIGRITEPTLVVVEPAWEPA